MGTPFSRRHVGRSTPEELPESPRFNFTRDLVEAKAAADRYRIALAAVAAEGVIDRRTFSEVAGEAARWAGLLRTRNLTPGDRAIVQLPASPGWCSAILGLLKAGFVVVPCSMHDDDEELLRRATDSGARLIIAQRRACLAGRARDIPRRRARRAGCRRAACARRAPADGGHARGRCRLRVLHRRPERRPARRRPHARKHPRRRGAGERLAGDGTGRRRLVRVGLRLARRHLGPARRVGERRQDRRARAGRRPRRRRAPRNAPSARRHGPVADTCGVRGDRGGSRRRTALGRRHCGGFCRAAPGSIAS